MIHNVKLVSSCKVACTPSRKYFISRSCISHQVDRTKISKPCVFVSRSNYLLCFHSRFTTASEPVAQPNNQQPIQTSANEPIESSYSAWKKKSKKPSAATFATPEQEYNSRILQFQREQKYQDAERKWEEMKAKNITIDPKTYNVIMKCLSQLGKTEKMIEAYQRMLKHNVLPSLETFTLMIEGFQKRLEYANMIKFYWKMKHHSIEPSFQILKSMTEGIISKSYSEFMQYLQQGGYDESDINIEAFNVFIHAFGKRKLPHVMTTVFDFIEQTRLKPNSSTYQEMISGFANAGKTEEMWDYFHEMEQRGFAVDSGIFNTLIEACGKRGDIDAMKKTFQTMSTSGVSPNKQTYNIMIHYTSRLSSTAEVFEMFHKMEQQGFQADLDTYNCIIYSYGKAGDMISISTYLEKMNQLGLKPNASTFNVLIQLAANSGDTESAVKYYKQMAQDMVKPDEQTYNILIETYNKKLFIGEALKYWQQMKRDGLKPNLQSFNSMLRTYSTKGEVELMAKYYQQMIKDAIKPDEETFRIMIEGYAKKGDATSALFYMEKMKKLQFVVTEEIVKQIMNSFVLIEPPLSKIRADVKSDVPSARKQTMVGTAQSMSILMDRLQDIDVTVSSHDFEPIFQSYGKFQCLKQAAELFALMKQREIIITNSTAYAFLKELLPQEVKRYFKPLQAPPPQPQRSYLITPESNVETLISSLAPTQPSTQQVTTIEESNKQIEDWESLRDRLATKQNSKPLSKVDQEQFDNFLQAILERAI